MDTKVTAPSAPAPSASATAAVKPAPRKKAKSGWKTSEFQTMALFQFGNICAALSGVVKPEHAALAAAIAQAAYAVSRGLAKSSESAN